MYIQVKQNSKTYYIQTKPVRRAPTVTPFRSKAWNFENLGKCKNVRDDVLDYYKGAVICG